MKLMVASVFLFSVMVLFLNTKLEAKNLSKIFKQEWVCDECEQENPFWYSLCTGCGKFYW